MSYEYDKYLLEHKTNVNRAFIWLLDNLPDVIEVYGFPCGSLYSHDASKTSPDEYDAYDKYFYGEKTDAVKENFDYAWLHHIHNNPHHWQYWVLLEDDPENGTEYKALEMPKAEVLHMICDWWSFSFKKGDLSEIFSWYKDHKDKMKLHPETRKSVEYILRRIEDKLDEEKDGDEDEITLSHSDDGKCLEIAVGDNKTVLTEDCTKALYDWLGEKYGEN